MVKKKDKPRSKRLSVFTNCARNVIEKAKYKRKNSTRKIAKNLQHHNVKVSSTTVWRYMTNKGWKAFKLFKIPLLKEGSFEICQEILQAHGKEFGKTSYSQMSVRSIYFNTRIQKTTSYGALRSATFPGIPGEAKSEGDGVGR